MTLVTDLMSQPVSGVAKTGQTGFPLFRASLLLGWVPWRPRRVSQVALHITGVGGT